jgi:hypothetical protein
MIQIFYMEDECPICLEPLKGTLVELGCCKHKIHIQCYVPKCPLCRAELPTPRPVEVVVPVPVPVPVVRAHPVQQIVPMLFGFFILGGIMLILNYS